MARPSHSPLHWLELVLACFALAALAPAHALATAPPQQTVVVAGPAGEVRRRTVCAVVSRVAPRPTAALPLRRSPPTEGPCGSREPLFLLHRALLR